MINTALFLHHKDTYGDTYSVDCRADQDGYFVIEFKHKHKDCYEAEMVNAYITPALARGLRDRLTELLTAPSPEPVAESKEVAK